MALECVRPVRRNCSKLSDRLAGSSSRVKGVTPSGSAPEYRYTLWSSAQTKAVRREAISVRLQFVLGRFDLGLDRNHILAQRLKNESHREAARRALLRPA
jgi:hypothetical protein